MTNKQIERQRHRKHGRYAVVNPCYCCGKSAGVDYLSHPMTDQIDSDGNNWGDRGLCLCSRCLEATEYMTRVVEFRAYISKLL
jgi:hypothetical protein